MEDSKPVRLSWKANIPDKTRLKFQLCWARLGQELSQAAWRGPAGVNSYYETSGAAIEGVAPGARWLQYRAVLISFNGCRSVQLEEVRIDLAE